MKMTKKIIVASVFLSLALGGIAFAQISTVQPLPSFSDTTTVFNAVTIVTNWIFTIMLIAAVIMILLAAFQFITGGGDEKNITEARQKILYAAVGIVIALLAKAVPILLKNILG